MTFRASLQPAARLGGLGPRRSPNPQRLRDRPAATRRRRAQSTRKARLARGARRMRCAGTATSPSARPQPLGARPGTLPSFGSATADSRTADPTAGAALADFSFFFQKLRPTGFDPLGVISVFWEPRKRLGRAGGDLGEASGKARGWHGQAIPILAKDHPPSRLTLLFPGAENAKRGAGSPCIVLRIARKKPCPFHGWRPCRQEGQQSIEMPFNRHLKRRDYGFFALPRQAARGARPRHGLMALGKSTLLACRPLSSSPAQRGRFAPMPMRCDRASLLVFSPRFVGSARTSKKARKNAATKNGVAGLSGRAASAFPRAQGRSTDAAHPTPLQLAPNNRQGQRRWKQRRESKRPDF